MAAQPLPLPPTPGPVPVAGPLSQVSRVINTFVAPSKTFADLRRSASWWLPFLLTAVASIALVYVVDKNVGFRRVTENQIQMSPKQADRLEQMAPEQRENQIAAQVKVSRYFSYGFSAFILVWYLIVSGVLFATFKFGASADLTFKATFAVVMYAGLPGLIKTLLAMVSVLAGVSGESFTFQNPVATNPGYFMERAASPFLYGIATSLDIFLIWTLVLTAIGLSVVSKLKRSTAMAGVFGWYVVFVLAASALGTLS